jgi:hypothetical protein
VPIAIGMLTGGAGFGVALAPVISGIVQKLRDAKLNIPTGIADKITDVIKGKTDDAVKSLVDTIAGENPGKGVGAACDVSDTIKLVLGEEPFPVISELKAAIGILTQQKGDLKDIFEGWMDEQREALDNLQASQSDMQDSIDEGFQFTRNELARIDDEIGKQLAQLGTKIDAIASGQAQTTAMLTRMEKGMESFLREVCAGDVATRSLDLVLAARQHGHGQDVERRQCRRRGSSGRFDPSVDVRYLTVDR